VYPGVGKLGELHEVVQRQRDTRIIVDHLGMIAPPVAVPKPPPEPFEDLDLLLELAIFDNVMVKISAVPSLSHEAFPFRDVFEPIRRVLDAFGSDRVMWGTDATRTAALHSYRDAVEYLEHVDGVDADTRKQLYGGNAQRVFRWPR
jgi:predicted TIM-barrel fold metal-dependent hydrolase